MIINVVSRGLVYRLKASDKLDEMWDSLSKKARDRIAAENLWFNDYLFEKLGTPEEVNKFFEKEWIDDDE